jgi:hypothetical protein
VASERPREYYFGGRSEVRIRREITRVILCDFLSMYPTICTLMELWRLVIADSMSWRDATTEVTAFLDRVELSDLLRPETWRNLSVLVQVVPEEDVFPVRAMYADAAQATIGLNYLTSDHPLWLTLADCVASRILTGRTPKIRRAIAFNPGPPQPALRSINIAGDPAYRVDPAKDDFYKRLIELRQRFKGVAAAQQMMLSNRSGMSPKTR